MKSHDRKKLLLNEWLNKPNDRIRFGHVKMELNQSDGNTRLSMNLKIVLTMLNEVIALK